MACPSAKLQMHRYSQDSEDGGRQGRIHVEFSHLLCSKAMKGRGRMLATLACSVADPPMMNLVWKWDLKKSQKSRRSDKLKVNN